MIPVKLPNAKMQNSDGSYYEPPDWVIKDVLPKLMDLPDEEYIKLRMWLAVPQWFFAAIRAANNPLLPQLFDSMALADKFAYLSQYTPPPGASKQ